VGFKKVKYFLLFLNTQYIRVFLEAPQNIVFGEGFGLRDDGFGVIKLSSDDLKPSNLASQGVFLKDFDGN
jgi:hypothetical protein